MKKLASLLFCILLMTSCNNDDDPDCPLLTEPITQPLFINLVDAEGNNLIENGTYNADDILIRFNDFEITNVVFDDIQGIESLIVLNIFGTDGDNTFELQLSDSETDILIINLTIVPGESPCGFSFPRLNFVSYNGENQTIEDFEELPLITVVK